MIDEIAAARARREAGVECVVPFSGLDETDGVTSRESRFFVLGVEYEMVRRILMSGEAFSRPVHADNAERLRALAVHLGVVAQVEPHVGYEGCEGWVEMTVIL